MAYAALALPLAVVGLPLTFYIPPLYAQSRGLALGAISAALLLARVADFVIDPLIGMLSDRINTPIGRRRPWIAAGAALTVIGVRHVFAPPPGIGMGYLLGWILVLYTGWSMVSIPYYAWGGSLSTDYHRRSVITGAREFFGMLGLVASSVAPGLFPDPDKGKFIVPMAHLADWISWLLPFCALLILVGVREPAAPPPPPPAQPAGSTLKLLWRNGPFRLLMGATLLGGIGTAVNGALIVFFLQQLHLDNHPELLLYFLLSAVVGVPFWVWLARRVGKHRALCYGAIWGCCWFAVLPFIPDGAYRLVAMVNLMAGLSIGAAPVLGASIAADVIDFDALRVRQDRSALFFSLWAMGAKATQAVGVLALPLVGLLGFDPQGPVTPRAHLALAIGYVGVPIFFWLSSLPLLWNFPIDRKRQARIAKWREIRAVKV